MPNTPKKVVSAPLRISPELKEKLDQASEALGIKQAEVMRLALDIGLADLRSINWDIAGAVLAAVQAGRAAADPPTLKVAEIPPEYQPSTRSNGGES